MHSRKAVRHALRDIALGNPQAIPSNPVYPLPGIGPKVYTNRPTPFFKPELDSLCFYSPEEESDDRDTNPPILFRDCDFVAEFLFSVDSRIMDDKADDYAEALENLLNNDPTLRGTVSKHRLVRTDLGLVADDATRIYGSLRLGWRVEYQTRHEYTPPANTGNFDTLHTRMELGGNNAAPESEDHTTGIYQGD